MLWHDLDPLQVLELALGYPRFESRAANLSGDGFFCDFIGSEA